MGINFSNSKTSRSYKEELKPQGHFAIDANPRRCFCTLTKLKLIERNYDVNIT